VESVTLTTPQIPAHSHVPLCNSAAGTKASPQNDVWAALDSNVYSDVAPSVIMASAALGPAGGSQPHDNMVPFLVINFIISLFGVFPSPT
jgi:microcystin-dependent protein